MKRLWKRVLTCMLAITLAVSTVPANAMVGYAQSQEKTQVEAEMGDISEIETTKVISETETTEEVSEAEVTEELSETETTEEISEDETTEEVVESMVADEEETYCWIDFYLEKATLQEVYWDEESQTFVEWEDNVTYAEVPCGSDFFFTVECNFDGVIYSWINSFLVSTDGTENGAIQPYTRVEDKDIYKITPTEDMDIYIKALPISVDVIFDETQVVSISKDYISEDCFISDDMKTIEYYNCADIDISIEDEAGKAFRVYHTYTVGEEDENGNWIPTGEKTEVIPMDYSEGIGEYDCTVELTSDSLSIEIKQVEIFTVNFETENAYVTYVLDPGPVGGFYENGDAIESTDCADGDTLYFSVTKEVGNMDYLTRFVSTNGTESGNLEPCGTVAYEETPVYSVKVTSDMTITAKMIPHMVQLNVDVPNDILETIEFTSDNEISVSDDMKTLNLYEGAYVDISLEAEKDQFFYVYHTYIVEEEDENGDWVPVGEKTDKILMSYDEERESYSCRVEADYLTTAIEINQLEAFTVNFDTENADIREVYIDDNGNFCEEYETIESLAYPDGDTLYFTVTEEIGSSDYITPFVSTDGAETGKLEPCGFTSDLNVPVYSVKVDSDMTITAKMLPKTVPLNINVSSDVLDTIEFSGDNEILVSNDMKTLGLYDGTNIDISLEAEEGQFFRVYNTYTVEEENDNGDYVPVQKTDVIHMMYDEETGCYTCTVEAGYWTDSIEIIQLKAFTVYFDTDNAIITKVYVDGNDNFFKEDETIDSIVYPDGEILYFTVTKEKGDDEYLSSFVSIDGTESGRLEPCGFDFHTDEAVYSVKVTSDMTIMAKKMPRTIPVNGDVSLADCIVTTDVVGSISVDDKNSLLGIYESNISTFRFKGEQGKEYGVYYTYVNDTAEYVKPVALEYDNSHYSFDLPLNLTVKEISIFAGELEQIKFMISDEDEVSVQELYPLKDSDDYAFGKEFSSEEVKEVLNGKSIYFKIVDEDRTYIRYTVSIGEDVIAPYTRFNGEDIYKISPTEDVVVNVTTVSKSVKINGVSGLTGLSITTENEYAEIAADYSEVKYGEETLLNIKFKEEEDIEYSVVVTHTKRYEMYDENGGYLYDYNGNILYESKTYTHSKKITPTGNGYYTVAVSVNDTTDSIDIFANSGSKLSFKTEDVRVREVFMYEDESDYMLADEYMNSYETVATGGCYYFLVEPIGDVDNEYFDYDFKVRDQIVKPYWENAGTVIYKIVPTDNMNISATIVPKYVHTVNTNGELQEFSIWTESNYKLKVSEDKKEVSPFGPMNVIFQFAPAERMRYSAYYTYERDTEEVDENGNPIYETAKEEIQLDEDEEGYYFTVRLDDTVKSIYIEQKELVKVTFAPVDSAIYTVTAYEDEEGIHYKHADAMEEDLWVVKGEEMIFSVATTYDASTPVVYFNGEEISLEGKTIDNGYYFKINPVVDVTLATSIKPHVITVNKPSALQSFAIEWDDVKDPEISEDKSSIGIYENNTVLSFTFKPRKDKLYDVTYTTWEDEYDEELEESKLVKVKKPLEITELESGKYYFELYANDRDVSINIDEYTLKNITFNISDAAVFECYKDDTDFVADEEIENGTISLKEGEDFYFTVENKKTAGKVFVSANEEEVVPFVSESGYKIYTVTATEDMTISVKVVPQVIPFEYEILPENLAIATEDDTDFAINLSKKTMSYSDRTTVEMEFTPDENYLYYVYQYDEHGEYNENNEFEKIVEEWIIDPVLTDDGNYLYEFTVSDSTQKVTLDVRKKCNVTFVGEHAQFYDEGFFTQRVLPEGKPFEFTVEYDTANFVLKHVVATGVETEVLIPRYDDVFGIDIYSIIPTGDMVITAVAVPTCVNVSFNKISANMSYEMAESEYVSKNDNGGYEVSYKAETIDFYITSAKEGIAPVVTYENNRNKEVIAEYCDKNVNEKGLVVYTYKVLYEDVNDTTEFFIGEGTELYDIYVKCENAGLDTVTALIDNNEAEGIDTFDENTFLFRTGFGKDVDLELCAKDGYKIISTETIQGDIVTTKQYNNKFATVNVGVVADTVIKVELEEKPQIIFEKVVSDGEETIIIPSETISEGSEVLGRYDISDGLYRGNILDNNGNTLGVAEITVEEKYLPYFTVNSEGGFEFDATSLLNADSKPLKHTISVRAKDCKTKKSVQFVLLVSPKLQSVVVDGVVNNELSQVVDTSVAYSLIADVNAVDFSTIGVEVAIAEGMPEDVVTATLEDGALIIQTSANQAAKNVAVIKLYRKNFLQTDEEYYISGSEFVLHTINPVELEKMTPDVKYESADDTSVTLSIKIPDSIQESENGRQYYKVVVTPKEGEPREPIYIEREIPDFSHITNAKKLKDAKDAYRQMAKVVVDDAPYGYGEKSDYDIEVSMVQTVNKDELRKENEQDLVVYTSKTFVLNNVSTKDPLFATDITVKKGKTTVYTEQKNILAATVGFNKATVNRDIAVVDITACENSEKLQVRVDGTSIYVDANEDTMLGKHTLQITPLGVPSLYQKSKTLTVTVQKGIKDIELQVPSYRLYKQAKKAASMTVKAIYNSGDVAAKTKKVSWEVVNEAGNAFVVGEDLYGKIQIKNGKVTVNKAYTVQNDSNKFRVKATAADFAGNETTVLSDVITITSEPQEIETLIVIKENAKTGLYDVVAKDGDKVTSDVLHGMKIVTLQKGTPIKTSYTKTEIATYQLAESEVTYKSSNAAIKVIRDEDTRLNVTKTANKVTLKATTTDGGKKNKSIKIDVIYQTPEELGLAFYQEDVALSAVDTRDILFGGTINSKITIVVNQKVEEYSDWDTLDGFTNYSVSVKNAKILSSDKMNGIYEIVVTKDAATITLQDKCNKESKKYYITNEAYSSEKAPKVKVENSLRANDGSLQSIEFTLPNTYDYSEKYVIVETDAVTKQKNLTIYRNLENACEELGSVTRLEGNKFSLSFESVEIPKANYKLTVTIGTVDNNSKFVAIAKPVSLTLKSVVPKAQKGSFKPATSYKIAATPGATVSFTGTGKEIKSFDFTKLYNANISGKENAFLTYFTLENNRLILKDNLTDEDIKYLTSKAAKNDLTGYVTYTAICGDDGYGNPYSKTETVKISVKFK